MKAKLPAKIAGIVVLGVIAYFVAKPFIGTSIKEKTTKADSTQVVKDSVNLQTTPTEVVQTEAQPVVKKKFSKPTVTKTTSVAKQPVEKHQKEAKNSVKSVEKKKDSRDNLDITNF